MNLSLAKIVEARKRSRVDRARQLADNIETQAHILKAIDLYNLEAEKRRIETAIGHIGNGVQLNVAQEMAKTRLNFLKEKAAKLEVETSAIPMSRPYWKGRPKAAVMVGPLDKFLSER